MQRSPYRAEAAEQAVLALVQEHAAELLRFARRFSYCADDAHDAYQRALETLVRRMRSDPPAQPLPWVRSVLRREAVALRCEREVLVGHSEADFERHVSRELADPAERAVDHERVRHAAEALGRLKPQELTALALRAEGLSYREICDRTGWTYTRANRAITEGRRALRDRLGAIESGAECERWTPLLSALADGEATAAELAQLRPHLRACSACRATLRDFHAAPAQVAAVLPAALVPLVAAAPSPPDASGAGHVAALLHTLAERATLLAARVQGAFEAVPGTKLAAVAASTAALAGGGAVLQQTATGSHARSAATHAARAAASSSAASLTTLPASWPTASGAARGHGPHGRRGAGRRSEFAQASRPRSEFVRAAPQAEFAAASARAAGKAATATPAAAAAFAAPDPAPAAARVPAAPAGGGSAPPTDQAEFAGP